MKAFIIAMVFGPMLLLVVVVVMMMCGGFSGSSG